MVKRETGTPVVGVDVGGTKLLAVLLAQLAADVDDVAQPHGDGHTPQGVARLGGIGLHEDNALIAVLRQGRRGQGNHVRRRGQLDRRRHKLADTQLAVLVVD